MEQSWTIGEIQTAVCVSCVACVRACVRAVCCAKRSWLQGARKHPTNNQVPEQLPIKIQDPDMTNHQTHNAADQDVRLQVPGVYKSLISYNPEPRF